MRPKMTDALTTLLGPSVRSREGCDWWVCIRSSRRDLHVCLNSPCEGVAHVVIFDPDATEGRHVTDVSATNQDEIDSIIRRLQDMGC